MNKVWWPAMLLLLYGTAWSQTSIWKKYGMDNTQFYFVKLPNGVDNHSLQVHIVSASNKRLPKQMYFNGEQIAQQNQFIHIDKQTNMLYGQRLPFFFPANTWIFAFNYSDNFLLVDNDIKIKITTKNRGLSERWKLPAMFDMRPDMVLSMKKYNSLSPNELSGKYIPTLSLQKITEATFSDTTLVYNIKKIPVGIKMICTGINAQSHSTQEFEVNGALLYKNELFFYVPLPTVTKPLAKYPDQCNGKMTDVAGNIGFASGCITGNGSGKCAGILQHEATKRYRVSIILEP